MMSVTVNDRWPLQVTYHRAARWLAAERQQIGYERQRLQTMSLHIRPTDTVFDIGAEQGDISALIGTWVPQGRMVLVEPSVDNWPSIKATFDANHLPPPFGAHVGFCGSETSESPAMSLWTNAWPTATDGPVVPTIGYATRDDSADNVQTVDSLTRNFGPPDVITVDVEGDELAVLGGAAQTLSEHRPHLFISVHPQFHTGPRWAASEIYEYLESHRYRLWHLGGDHEIHIHAEPRT